MALTFAAQVKAFQDKTMERITAVVRQSCQDVIGDAQRPVGDGGRLPVDTGNLRNNVTTEIVGGASAKGGDAYVLVIAQMEAGDTIRHSYHAEYAPHVEYGARGRRPRFFVRGATERWQEFVAQNVSRVAGGR